MEHRRRESIFMRPKINERAEMKTRIHHITVSKALISAAVSSVLLSACARADAVRTYLIEQGIGAIRLTSLGKGEEEPVADNDSAEGRQQNWRVEVIISNPPAALN